MPDLWPFRPEIGCKETLEWYSEVMRSRTGEQRLSLREAPRQKLSYSHRLLDQRQFARARAFARINGAEAVYVPVWAEQVAYGPVASGDDVLTFDTTWGDWRVGSFLVVWQDDENYAVREIAAITDADILLTAAVGHTYTAAFIVPVRTAILVDGFSVSRGKVHMDMSASFTVSDNIDLSADYVSAYPQYQSLDVMTDPPRLVTDVAESIVRSSDYVDNGFGPIAVETERNYVDYGMTVVYHDERPDLWARRLWLHALRGKQQCFWMPSFSQDLVLQATVGAASTTISVASIAVAGYYIGKHVMIERTNGARYFREITNAAVAGGGVDALAISSALGVTTAPADVAMFCFISLVRLDSDSVDIEHRYELCSVISIPVLEVPLVSEDVDDSGPEALMVSGSPVLDADEGDAYAGFTVSGSGGVPPYAYSLQGSWPAGISINGSTGAVSGTPSENGTFAGLSVRVTDSAAATDDLPTFTLVVDAAGTLAISGAPVTSAVEDEAYDGFTASAANGTPPYVYSLQGSWPTGITIDSSTGVVSGTPTSSGSFTSLSVRVTDDVAATDDLPTFTLVVETTGGFAWPNASNTGYSGALTAYSGPNPITVDGTVVQDKHITASIEVVADDVQFLNCWIDYTDAFGVQGSGATGLLIEDCTFTAHGGNAPILSGVSATIRRCNLSGAENGIVLQDGAHLVELNYLHDLDNSDPLGHPDGISVQGGQNGTVIQDNHIEACGTSAVFLKCDFGSIINTTIYHNRLKNMGVVDNDMYRFAVYSITGPHGTPTGTIISNNIIQQGFFGGYWATDGSVTITGNIDYDTGNPI